MRNKFRNPRGSKHANTDQGANMIGEKDLKALLETTENPLVLILDCVQDPHNLGACLRTCDGAGVTAVIVPKDKPKPPPIVTLSQSNPLSFEESEDEELLVLSPAT